MVRNSVMAASWKGARSAEFQDQSQLVGCDFRWMRHRAAGLSDRDSGDGRDHRQIYTSAFRGTRQREFAALRDTQMSGTHLVPVRAPGDFAAICQGSSSKGSCMAPHLMAGHAWWCGQAPNSAAAGGFVFGVKAVFRRWQEAISIIDRGSYRWPSPDIPIALVIGQKG